MADTLNFLKNLFLLKYLPQLGTNASYGLLFLFGIMTSFHCLAMCGGIAISQTVSSKDNKFLAPSFLYNLGRIISYTLVGLLTGALGNIVGFTGVLRGIVPIIGGLFMIIMAINLLGIFPWLRRFNIRMPLIFAKKLRNGKDKGPFYIGMMSGLMPCGPLQIVELYALGTRSALFGAVSMFFFAIGTVPVLFIFGAINSIINKKYSNKVLKFSAILVLILGIVMIDRGLSLFGISVEIPKGNNEKKAVAVIDGNVQRVAIKIKSDKFYPIVVQKGIPVEWTVKVDSDDLNDCNDAIEISQFKIEKKLSEGDNLIEFTPQDTGEISYTCWMGMIKSKITVVDNIKRVK